MKHLFSLLACCILTTAFSQVERQYLVKLTDKTNTPYSINRPSEFLSAKSIERRRKQNITVTLRDLPVDPAYVATIEGMGLKVFLRSKWMNAVSVATNDLSKIDQLRQLSFVKEIILTSDPASTKVSSKFGNVQVQALPQTRVALNYGPSFFQVNQIGMDCMHNNGFHGEGMTIAVLDAGFFKADSLPAFDSLRNENRLLGCRDMVTGDTMVFEDYPHGMNVLSCMGANLPGQLIGTAPKASFWLIRTEDAATETLQEEVNWLAGAEFADSVGADVINSSLGYSKFDGGIGDHFYSDMDGNTTIVTNAADWAVAAGVFVTTSAGNSGGFPWYKITAPADADSVLTVGAVDSAGVIAGFSGRGPTADGRIKPNVCARGVQTVIAANGGGITTSGGTSFSSPLMAGSVACLWQANPGANILDLIYAIHMSASQALVPDTIQGFGIPDFCKADSILSVMLSVNDHATDGTLEAVHPNPFTSSFQITFFCEKNEAVDFEVFDLSGRVVLHDRITSVTGKNQVSIQAAELASGAYILSVHTKQYQHFEKIIKH